MAIKTLQENKTDAILDDKPTLLKGSVSMNKFIEIDKQIKNNTSNPLKENKILTADAKTPSRVSNNQNTQKIQKIFKTK